MDSDEISDVKFSQIEKIIHTLFNRSKEDYTKDVLIREIEKQGFQEAIISQVIRTLINRGVIYQPQKGKLRKVNLNPVENEKIMKDVLAE
ncbi:MAG: hypothetical protein ACTSW1_04825 [Candidatus Hodarchaeales archaeon]